MLPFSRSFVLFILLFPLSVFSQSKPEDGFNNPEDKYSKLANMLENGEKGIDFAEFRYSFLESEKYLLSRQRASEFDSLNRKLFQMIDENNYDHIIAITKQMLSIDYTSMIAHKYLRQTYSIVGDTVNARKYKDIQLGLLRSIINSGDGKTCSTGWVVINIAEEYFILNVLESENIVQSISTEGGVCDKMDVVIDGEEKTYYFEISRIFKAKERLKNKK